MCSQQSLLNPMGRYFSSDPGHCTLFAHQPVGRHLPPFPQHRDICSWERNRNLFTVFQDLCDGKHQPTSGHCDCLWPCVLGTEGIFAPEHPCQQKEMNTSSFTKTFLYPSWLCYCLSNPVAYLEFWLLEMIIFSLTFYQEKFQTYTWKNSVV